MEVRGKRRQWRERELDGIAIKTSARACVKRYAATTYGWLHGILHPAYQLRFFTQLGKPVTSSKLGRERHSLYA